CSCGQPYTLEMFGRIGYDFLKIAGATLYADFLDQTLIRAGINTDQYQLHVYEVIYRNRLTYKLILEVAQVKTDSQIVKKIEKNLYLSGRLTLGDLVKQEIFLPTEVKQVKDFNSKYKNLRIVSHLN